MKSNQVEFIKAHPRFVNEIGDVTTLTDADRRELLDGGYIKAVSATETAEAPAGQIAAMPTAKAVKATTDQRAEAHGLDKDSVVASIDENGTTVTLPVGTEPDGNKVLIRPEDNALASK